VCVVKRERVCVCVCGEERQRVSVECVSPQNSRSVSALVSNVLDAQPVLDRSLIRANPSSASELTNGRFISL